MYETNNQSIVNHIKSKAFTLVEIIFVIAIVGILASLLLPGFNAIKREAQKLEDVAHLKKINDAWRTYTYDFSVRLSASSNISGYIEKLAGAGYQDKSMMVLNDSTVYFSKGDKYCSPIKNNAICKFQGSSISYMNPYWFDGANSAVGSNLVISYCIIMNLPTGAPQETTPFAFTRGLCTDGTWHDKYGLYGSSGGYVIYCDGHVRWFDNKNPAKFLKWDQSGYTNDIREAIPNTAMISCENLGSNNIRNDNGAIMIIVSSGTGGSE